MLVLVLIDLDPRPKNAEFSSGLPGGFLATKMQPLTCPSLQLNRADHAGRLGPISADNLHAATGLGIIVHVHFSSRCNPRRRAKGLTGPNPGA